MSQMFDMPGVVLDLQNRGYLAKTQSSHGEEKTQDLIFKPSFLTVCLDKKL